MYDRGEGVEKAYGEAVRWYRKAAAQGYSRAQNSLGVSYYEGEGVKKDYEEAAKWFIKASEQGHPLAQYNLGLRYYKGEGVQKDFAEAAKWFSKASEQGHPLAQYNLGLMYAYGRGVNKDFVQGYAWLNVAATKLENARASKDKMEQGMSAQQLAEGQKRTRELRARLENKPQAAPGIGGEDIPEERDGGRSR
jgi:TPR repeat protein